MIFLKAFIIYITIISSSIGGDIYKYYELQKIESINEKKLIKEINSIDLKEVNGELCPFMSLTGLPGSGKGVVSKRIAERYKKDIISTDDYFELMRKNKDKLILDFINNNSDKFYKYNNINEFVSNTRLFIEKDYDLFRELEMNLFLKLLYSGKFKNKVLDFGGSIYLQPSVIKALKNCDVYNFVISKERRVSNLIHDFLSTKKRQKYVLEIEKILNKNNIKESEIENIKHSYLEYISKNEEFENKIYQINNFCETLNNKRDTFVFKKIKKAMSNVDNKELFRIKFNRQAKKFNVRDYDIFYVE